MRMVWWGAVIYLGLVGIAEITDSATATGGFLTTFAGLPSLGSIADSVMGSTATAKVDGVIDIAGAAAIYWFVIR